MGVAAVRGDLASFHLEKTTSLVVFWPSLALARSRDWRWRGHAAGSVPRVSSYDLAASGTEGMLARAVIPLLVGAVLALLWSLSPDIRLFDRYRDTGFFSLIVPCARGVLFVFSAMAAGLVLVPLWGLHSMMTKANEDRARAYANLLRVTTAGSVYPKTDDTDAKMRVSKRSR